MVVNDKKNLPKTVKLIPVKELNFLLTRQFLTEMTKQGMGNGVARNNYYMINVDAMLRIPHNAPVGEYRKFSKMLEAAEQCGYSYLMFII